MVVKKIDPIRTSLLRSLFAGLVLALSLPASLAFGQDAKIGFVDLQKAVSGTKEWKKEFATFKTDFQKEKSVIAEKEKSIRQELEDLNKQGFVLSPDLKKKKEEGFMKDKREFERYVQDRNEEYNRKEKQITDNLLQKMIKVVQAMGKEKKYTMILERSAVFYFSPDDDLTDLAIKAYDKANP
ncbi:MAG: OmpH family outer membrane protein [Nitrospinae bacterium]|nr:OmpH family outer membrane protein [Nitrospinota bacterium]